MKRHFRLPYSLLLGGALAGALLSASPASACGCFAPQPSSSTTMPTVQAGERILFSVDNSQVTAHIQIQYAGDSSDFGWLLPLPSLPTMELGSDEVFTQLSQRTAPTFTTNRTFEPNCNNGPAFGCAASTANSARGGAFETPGAPSDAGMSPLVVQDSLGPYEYAVLKADDKTAMIDWLNTNRYLIPAGTDKVLGNYIHTGAYFLALKLKSGKSTGDIQPVVVHYASDLPMIPIALTSVGAVANMGIEVWVAGSARAIPRNYAHLVIDQAAIDWSGGASNYNQVVIKAVQSAPKHHAFVTEFAGASSVMKQALVPPGRFGNLDTLRMLGDLETLIGFLRANNYGPYPFTGTLRAVMAADLVEPAELSAAGVSQLDFASRPDFWLGQWAAQNPGKMPPAVDMKTLTNDIATRVAQPILDAQALLDSHPKLTRLFTALSPEDMNLDPVFSFNPELPDVSASHTADLHTLCDGTVIVTTDDGLEVKYDSGFSPPAVIATLPGALRIETLREAGAPQVQVDNTGTIKSATGQSSGCRTAPGPASRGELWMLCAIGIAIVAVRRRRRRA